METQTNLSCLLYGPGKARLKNRPTPTIDDPHDVLIRIAFVGVCGSDVRLSLRFSARKKLIAYGLGTLLDTWGRAEKSNRGRACRHGP